MSKLLPKKSELPSTVQQPGFQTAQQPSTPNLGDQLDAPASWSRPPRAASTQDIEADKSEETNESTAIGHLAGPATSQPSFLVEYWHYILVVVAILGWVFFQLFLKREPTFKAQAINHKKKASIENPKGQFKRSERFAKPKNKEDSANQETTEVGNAIETKDESSEALAGTDLIASANLIDGKQTNKRQADTMQSEQPGDEEFDFDLNEGDDDSDVFNVEDAAEINGAKDDKRNDGSSKRFKTEEDFEAAGIKSDELVSDDDEFGAFDDEDSQLSLADSDAEFGFDLDDDESSKFLDSGKATEVIPEASTVADDEFDDLVSSEITDDAEDARLDDMKLAAIRDAAQEVSGSEVESANAGLTAAAAVGVAASAKKRGFFSRLFGGKSKKNASDEPIEDSQALSETGSTDSFETPSSDVEVIDAEPVEMPVNQMTNDSNDDLDFDLDANTDDSVELEFDMDDLAEGETPSSDVEVTDAEPVEMPVNQMTNEPNDDLEFDLDSNSDDSDELGFALDDLAEAETSSSDVDLIAADPVETPVKKATKEPNDDLEFDLDSSSDDSDELGFDMDDLAGTGRNSSWRTGK